VATEHIRGLTNLKSKHKSCVATIGNFDGVHYGHQILLAKVIEKAKLLNVPSVVITFEPLPKEYFGREHNVPRLTRWREKMTAFKNSGIDYVFVLHFDAKLASLSAEDFVKTILHDGLAVKHVIIGDDFRFGSKRLGDFEFLKISGQKYGFTVEAMTTVLIEQERVSSTRVREALAEGDHQLTEKLLSHPYTMQGRVIHGDQRGRIIGFPTANIGLHRNVTPVQGVYAVRMHGIAEKGLPGVANVGIRPTIGGTRSLLEVHLFDFNNDIYGRHVSIEFCKKIRDEKRFENLDLLKQQIFQDAAVARAYFKL
jgi:riboflavin kinase/FMN adenylyltransferase